ncbi:hypothetical protein SLS56_002668 [Neofusicoccum ribis]|uniref:NECAP PHear domain-containing protein n=1 Tax=Neofusicoccum ribis TaxID=45134 RepID=A0ABR3T2M7_9PEZI
MATFDPTTGKVPADAIQRVLFVSSRVQAWQVPPLTSTKGYTAAGWTEDKGAKCIFTGRLRILETAIPRPSSAAAAAAAAAAATANGGDNESNEDVRVDILLEMATTGELFAAAPYTAPAVVEQVLDSSRWFAVQVTNGQFKAILGLGFEERSEAMDFNIALQDARKVLGLEPKASAANPRAAAQAGKAAAEEKKDFSLKEGETITVNIGGRGRRSRASEGGGGTTSPAGGDKDALFSIKPPPAAGGGGGGDGPVPFLPPPPSASSVKAERRRSRPLPPQGNLPPAEKQPSPQELGFDDGEFGEFQ